MRREWGAYGRGGGCARCTVAFVPQKVNNPRHLPNPRWPHHSPSPGSLPILPGPPPYLWFLPFRVGNRKNGFVPSPRRRSLGSPAAQKSIGFALPAPDPNLPRTCSLSRPSSLTLAHQNPWNPPDPQVLISPPLVDATFSLAPPPSSPLPPSYYIYIVSSLAYTPHPRAPSSAEPRTSRVQSTL